MGKCAYLSVLVRSSPRGPSVSEQMLTRVTVIVTFHEMMNGSASESRRRAAEGICEVDYVDPAAVRAARESLPSEAALRRAAEGFKTLGHPGRLRILKALDGRELCVCDVAEVLGVSMSGASQHLRSLRSMGAVDYRADGKLAYYTLADPFWLRLAETLLAKLESAMAATGAEGA